MNELYTRKRIDNSRLVRPVAPHKFREYGRLIFFGGVLAAACLLYGWQYFQCLELGYRLEALKSERAQAAELNQQLKLEAAALRAPGRIDVIARKELGLVVPVAAQPAAVSATSPAVLAEARRTTDSSTR